MNITVITAQQSAQVNRPFVVNSFLQKKEVEPENILQKLADKMVDTYERTEKLESEIRTHEIKMDEYTKTDDVSNLDRMEPEVLQMYQRIYELIGQSANDQMQELDAFQEHLESLDELMQQYQDMVDGKTSLADGMTKDDALNLLIAVQKEREDYVRSGAERLNQYADWIGSNNFDRYMGKVFGKNPFSGTDKSNWMIDASTSDIYAEIDRVRGAVSTVSEAANEGLRRIKSALEKRGGYQYKLYLDTVENSREPVDSEQKSMLEIMLERLKKAADDERKNS